LSAKQWIEKTHAIGITAKAGRYGGTYAHKDIAFNFGMWISPRFQLLLVKEYQRQQAIVEHPYGIIKRQWGFNYIMTKKTIKRAPADVGFIFISYNLRRLLNIVPYIKDIC